MPYVLVDEMSSNVMSVTSPTGQITMPSMQSCIVGESRALLFKGKNTSNVGQTMLINFYLFRPDNIVGSFEEVTASLAPGATMNLSKDFVFTMAGVWRADCRLFAWY